MRRLMAMTILMAGSSVAVAGGKDDAAVLKVHEDFAASWSKGDYKALAGAFADDADLISPFGRAAKGRAEIEKAYMEEQTGPLKGTHFTSDCKSGVRMLKPDVAVVTCAFEVTNGKLPDGSAMPPMKGIYTATMMKAKNKWSIVVGRPMIPFVPPAPPPAKK